ncbi:MAG: thiamine diphosphokinase [Chlorobi bacterium]|nr:MAG: thiamine pyrophosphokinase [Chlorobi bacterium OLB7]MBK8912050.1 thiamine diphosphokinase [Chlorobiota bacterium]
MSSKRGLPKLPKHGALLLIGGRLPNRTSLLELASGFRPIVAADGAGLVAVGRGLIPNVVIGDLDSVGPRRATLQRHGVQIIERPSQEENDFEKGLHWLIEQGETVVTVMGISGGLVDHTLNNFSIVAKFAHRLQLQFVDERSLGIVVVGNLEWATTPGQRISIIPLPSALLTTTGLRWELANEQLAIGQREGGSNKAIGDWIRVEVHQGVAAVVVGG